MEFVSTEIFIEVRVDDELEAGFVNLFPRSGDVVACPVSYLGRSVKSSKMLGSVHGRPYRNVYVAG